MNAILKYPGAKWRISDWIISNFPKHNVYLEPYFGSGAVFFNKPPAAIETINDIDGNVVNLFRVCREHPEELAALIFLTPVSRDEYVNDATECDEPIERARRTLVRYHQSFGTSNSSVNSWRNSQTANSPRIPAQWARLPEIIKDCCVRLKEAQIENYDAIELIKRYDNPDTLIYCDPPYLQSIRKRNMYKHEMAEAQHLELLSVLKVSKSKVVLSAYDNELYNSELSGWNTDEIKAQAQMGLQRVEKLYMNFIPQGTIYELLNM